MKLRHAILFTIPLVATFALAGCSAPATSGSGGSGGSGSGGGSSASAAPSDDSPAAAPAGTLAEPGTKVGLDTYLTHSFTNTDKGTALISAKLDSIEPATADELAVLKKSFGSKLDGYDLYLVRMTEKKESGDPVAFDSDYSFFDVVDAQGKRVQDVTLIGWGGCAQKSFDKTFDTVGTELKQCYVGAVSTGAKAPAGLAYVGGYEDNNPYDYLDGKPLLFLK